MASVSRGAGAVGTGLSAAVVDSAFRIAKRCQADLATWQRATRVFMEVVDRLLLMELQAPARKQCFVGNQRADLDDHPVCCRPEKST